MNLSIRWKLILGLSIPLLLTYAGMLGWDYWRLREAALAEAQSQVLERAQNFAGALNARLETAMQAAEGLAAAISRQPTLGEPQLRALTGSGFRQPLFGAAIIVAIESPEGASRPTLLNLRRGGGPPRAAELLRNFDVRETEPYKRVKADRRAQWVGPHEDRSGEGQSICTYIVPILNGETFRGAVAINVNVEELTSTGPRPPRIRRGAATQPATLPTMSPPEGAMAHADSMAIVGADGFPIAASKPSARPSRSLLDWARENSLAEFAEDFRRVQAGESTVARLPGLSELAPGFQPGEDYWIAMAPIPAAGWVFATAVPESTIINPIIERLWHRAGFLAAGLIILLVVTTFVSIRMSRPIEQMASAVSQLAAGNLDARVTGVTSRDELGQLAGAFNSMTTQLKSHVAALTEQTAAREAVEAELRIARKIQTDLLPRTFPPFPDRPEFDLHAINVPARQVAGDFYDFFFTQPNLLTIVIADVSGKGMPAALLMAVTRTIVRNLAMEGLPPAQIAERANVLLLQDMSESMFVTMFLLQYDTRTGQITYVNAGHPRPFRFGPQQRPAEFGDTTSALLGVGSSEELGPWEQGEEQLAPGQTLLFYTDGVSEARTPGGTMLRSSGIEKLLVKLHELPVQQLCVKFIGELDKFQDNQPADDVTIVALQRRA